MKLFQPLKPFRINQKFGENRACVDLATNSVYITCDGTNPPQGFKSVYGDLGHLGLDLAAYRGQPVYAAAAGTVSSIDTNPRTGLDVRIITESNGKKYLHWYEHLQGHNVKVGQWVKLGDVIGWADNTGYSSGDHLHLQLMVEVAGAWTPIDPLVHMESMCALDAKGIFSRMLEQLAVLSEKLAELARQRS